MGVYPRVCTLPGHILRFDGAINRRKAAVKRIESQVRSFYLYLSLSSSLAPLMSLSGPPRPRHRHCLAHLSSRVPDLPPRHYVTARPVASVRLSRAWQPSVWQVVRFAILFRFVRKERVAKYRGRFSRADSSIVRCTCTSEKSAISVASGYTRAYVRFSDWKNCRNKGAVLELKLYLLAESWSYRFIIIGWVWTEILRSRIG